MEWKELKSHCNRWGELFRMQITLIHIDPSSPAHRNVPCQAASTRLRQAMTKILKVTDRQDGDKKAMGNQGFNRVDHEKPVGNIPVTPTRFTLIWQVGPSSSPKPRLKVRMGLNIWKNSWSCKGPEKLVDFHARFDPIFTVERSFPAATTSEVSEVVNGKSHQYWCSACLL